MLKNLKLLKGITIALAFVLVLGGGILLKLTADAATKTVVYYISDEGDNTTGQDEASAFTSIKDAIVAANAEKFAPGTQLRFIVVDRVSISTQVLGGNEIAKDSAGEKLPITVTSLYDDTSENFSTIYLTYRMSSAKPESGSQRAIIYNDFNFKDIRIQAKVHDVYADNVNDGNQDNLYRIRNLYLVESKVTFDHCFLTSDLGDYAWTIYGENNKDSTNEFDTSLIIKDCNFSHVKIWLNSSFCVPNYNMYFYGENSQFAEYYITRRTNTATTDDIKSVNVHFKGCTLGNLYLSSSGGDISIPGGVNITVEDSEILKMAGSSGTPIVRANVTYNFIRTKIEGHKDLSKVLFFAPKGQLYGDITMNVTDSDFSVTDGAIYAIGNGGVIHGKVTHNISGTTFYRYVGGDAAKGTLNGTLTTNFKSGTVNENYVGGNNNGGTLNETITNNIESGTFKNNYFGGCYADGKMKAIVNNIFGGDFLSSLYFGTRYGEVTNNVTNNISGGTFDKPSYLYMGHNQGTFGKPTEKIEYRIKNTISNITTNRFAGGNAAKPILFDTENHGEFANGTIINYFGENLKFNNGCYPGGATVGAHTVKNTFAGKIDCGFVVGGINGGDAHIGTIYNTFEDGAVIPAFCGGNNGAGTIDCIVNTVNGGTITGFNGGGRSASAADVGKVINYFNGGTVSGDAYGGNVGGVVDAIESHLAGTTFTANFFGGSKAGTVGSATNHFKSGTATYFYGGSLAGDVGPIVNTMEGGTVSSNFFGGSSAGNVKSIENLFCGTDLSGNDTIYGGSKGGTISDCITNVINGGSAQYGKSWFYGGNTSATFGTPTEGANITYRIKNTLSNATFNRFAAGSNNTDTVGEGALGTVENHFGDGLRFITACYGGTNTKKVTTAKNTFTGKISGVFVCGGSNSAAVDNVFNTIEDGAQFPDFYGGSNGNSCGSIVNVVNGGTFAKYVGAGRGSGTTATTVQNTINGGTFTGNVFLGSDVGKVTTLNSVVAGGTFSGQKLDCYTGATTITLEIKPDDSKENLIFAFSGSVGLPNPGTASISIHGANKPIQLTSTARVNVDRILGDVTFLQLEEWKNGQVYVTLPTDTSGVNSAKFINFVSVDTATGSAEISTKSVEFAIGSTSNRTVLVGNSAAQAPAVVPASPVVGAVSFNLANNLVVNFYAEKEVVEKYISAIGSFPYSISFMGKTLVEGEITDLANAQVDGEYVRISTGFGIPATKYAEEITVAFCGNETVMSVYDILEIAASSTADQDLEALLKAIYNYGVEAETLVQTPSVIKFDGITYTGSYEFIASATSKVEGYNFSKVGLSLGEDVYLDFYLNAASTEGLTFVAKKADGTLVSAENIEVYPFSENSKYNLVISLRLDIASMDDVITLSVLSAEGTELANCTNSVASSCASYIQSGSEYAAVASALLAYVEKAQLI